MTDPYAAAAASAARWRSSPACLPRHRGRARLRLGAGRRRAGPARRRGSAGRARRVPRAAVPGHVAAVRSVGRRAAARWYSLAARTCTRATPVAAVVHGVRTAIAAGCGVVVLTNAAGGIRRRLRPGQPVLISDHINLTGRSPLAGPPPPDGYPSRFTDLTEAYSARLRAVAARPTRAWPRACTRRWPARSTRRRPRSGCSGPSAPTWSACPPRWKPSPPATLAPRCSACRWSPTSRPGCASRSSTTATWWPPGRARPLACWRVCSGSLTSLAAVTSDCDAARCARRVGAWIAADPDEPDRAELAALLADASREAAAELADRFAGRLEFGTAGLRGAVGAGPNRMNRAMVPAHDRRAGRLAARPRSDAGAQAGVVIGYDARHRSDEFAGEAARVLAGRRASACTCCRRQQPTPLLAFAVRKLRAAAGVMITASHNPRGRQRLQALPGRRRADRPARRHRHRGRDRRASGRSADVPLAAAGSELISPAWRRGRPGLPGRDLRGLARAASAAWLRFVYTPLHGVAGRPGAAGFRAGRVPGSRTWSQASPSRTPTSLPCTFPNPEEPGTLDLALAQARRSAADLVIANDPDGDRLAVAVPTRCPRRLADAHRRPGRRPARRVPARAAAAERA